MKIQELEIDRFGVWRGLNLPVADSNVTVFYGPNEAGKSTLMRFIRGILYGFQPQDERTPGPQPHRIMCRGVLHVAHDGKDFEILRETQTGTRGRLRVNGEEDLARNETQLAKILGGSSEAVFENVFAIGLEELQELSTLDAADVARHVYGMSLGVEGERVLHAQLAIEQDRLRLLGEDRRSGLIVDLAKQLDGFDHQIVKTGDLTQRHGELLVQREKLESEVAKTKRRQHDVQHNLRGWKFLDKVWAPWNRERQLKSDLAALPNLDGVTATALDDLDRIERELDAQDTRRQKLIEEGRRLYEQSEALQLEPQLEEHVCTIRKLVEQQDQVRQVDRTLGERRARAEALRKECEQRTPGGTGSLTAAKAGQLELGSSMTHLLLDRARRYRAAVSHRARLIRRYKKATSAITRRQAALEEETRSLGGLTASQAKSHVAKRLDELEQLMRLRIRQVGLEEAHAAATEHLDTAIRPRELPPFFYLCLWFFGVAGTVLFLAGLYGVFNGLLREGVGHTAWIIGACYAFLGLCAGGVTWTMREHFEPRQLDFSSLRLRHRDLEVELTSVNRSIDKILQAESARPGIALDIKSVGDGSDVTESEVMTAVRRRLIDLETQASREDAIEHARRRLSRRRQSIQMMQKDVAAARRDWCELLRKLGLSETIKISEAFQSWEKIAEARTLWNDWQQAQKDYDRDRLVVEGYRKTVEELAKQLSPDRRNGDAHILVSEWDRRLHLMEERRKERAALRQAAKQKRRDAEQFDGAIADLRGQRQDLLSRCHSTSREDLAHRVKCLKRHSELTHQLSVARNEISLIARTEPELALVEEDLLAYEPHRNKRLLETANQELLDLDRELEQSYEVLGRVKAEIRELEQDRRISSLRYDRAQVQADLQSAIEQLCTSDAALKSLERVRQKLETEGQSATLKLASRYLEQLTCTKYRRIWAPIGEKHLFVDDEQGQSFRVEHLSSGTREQVFLAVRLAMSREFADRGASLPLVLDDVTVNFDQVRTEAAVETLLGIADRGQQVLLFTCHLHLANLFKNHGIEPVWLPANAASEFRYAS
jgi:uncharacterized protein YhaN